MLRLAGFKLEVQAIPVISGYIYIYCKHSWLFMVTEYDSNQPFKPFSHIPGMGADHQPVRDGRLAERKLDYTRKSYLLDQLVQEGDTIYFVYHV